MLTQLLLLMEEPPEELALDAIIIVGKVISDKTIPPTSGEDLGKSKYPKKIDSPSKPKTIDGTAAKLLMLTSIISDSLFLGATVLKRLQQILLMEMIK